MWLKLFPEVAPLLTFGQWMLRLVDMVPISLLVAMEIVRYMQSKLIEWDVSMHSLTRSVGARVHRASLAEELGQVSYILSDKTGTLTNN